MAIETNPPLWPIILTCPDGFSHYFVVLGQKRSVGMNDVAGTSNGYFLETITPSAIDICGPATATAESQARPLPLITCGDNYPDRGGGRIQTMVTGPIEKNLS